MKAIELICSNCGRHLFAMDGKEQFIEQPHLPYSKPLLNYTLAR